MEPRPWVPEPHTRRHSSQGRMKALEWNWVWQAAKQSKAGWDKDLIRAQTENSSGTAGRGFVPKLRTWEDLTGWRRRSHRTLEDHEASQSAASVQKPEQDPFLQPPGEAFLDAQAVSLALNSSCTSKYLPPAAYSDGGPTLCTVLGLCTTFPTFGGCYLPHFMAKETEAQPKWQAHSFMNRPWRNQALNPYCLYQKCSLSQSLLFYLPWFLTGGSGGAEHFVSSISFAPHSAPKR